MRSPRITRISRMGEELSPSPGPLPFGGGEGDVFWGRVTQGGGLAVLPWARVFLPLRGGGLWRRDERKKGVDGSGGNVVYL